MFKVLRDMYLDGSESGRCVKLSSDDIMRNPDLFDCAATQACLEGVGED
jgi:hypothetical protein